MAEKKEQIGITVKKDKDFSEWYTQVIQKADLIEYTPVSGCYVFRPRSYAVWTAIQQFFDKKIKSIGVENAYFPLFIPESLLKKESSHVAGFTPEVAWVTQGGDSKLSERLAVRPTSETIIYDAFKKWIRSHRDLPLKVNQWCSVVRWEFKNPVPFLRTREFLWQEGHTAHATKESAEKEVLQVLDFYREVFEDLLAIPVIKGRKSEQEKFAGALYTTSVETFVPSGKGIQCATSHCLGQNFSRAFGIDFLDEKGGKQLAWTNSWGVSTRSIGIMTMMHSDDKGLVLPPKVAPLQVVIVPILFEDSKEKVLKEAEKVKESVEKHCLVKLDAREECSPGWKFNDWELKGVPLRIEIGPRDVEKKQVVVVSRDTGAKKFVSLKELAKYIESELSAMQQRLFKKAQSFIEKNTVQAKNWSEFSKAVKEKKLIKAFWCGGNSCEDSVKDKTEGVKIITIPFDQPKKLGDCVHCKKPAQKLVLFAKSY